MKKVCVIGAGISGLSSAVRIQEHLGHNVKVTIVSEKFSPHTTGDGAAGIIELHAVADTPVELQRKWCKETMRHCLDIYSSAESGEAGVYLTSAYMISSTKEDPHYKDIVFDYRWLQDEEFKQLFPHVYDKKLHIGQDPHYKDFVFDYRWLQDVEFKQLFPHVYDKKLYMLRVSTLMCECRSYLPWLMKRFKKNGGSIIQRKVLSFSELTSYDLVVNCTGLEARTLANDDSVRPLRGQSIRVKAPWIKTSVMHIGDSYVITCANNVMCGGTHQKDDWRTEPCDNDRKRIWEDCCKLVPSLKYATIDHEWVGLRPSRPCVRLEKEFVKTSQKLLPVVHNYGHGGAGISLHWGCAKDVAELVKDALMFNQEFKSKL